jgi:glycosyltransferase involved in cell wall biosynthesis
MVPVSVVIIAKNECGMIYRTIARARTITDDIVIIDSGSTDCTIPIASTNGCRIYQTGWDGYGANKNKGNLLARYNWILSLDADELIDDELIVALHRLDFDRTDIVYDIIFKNYFGKKRIRFGSWGRDHHIRLFNRMHVKWSDTPVHEVLLFSCKMVKKQLSGAIHHYSVKDRAECEQKGIYYAALSAQKYYGKGINYSLMKQYLSPLFGFIRNYIFLLGILDGREGWYIASNTAWHTWLKYQYLRRLQSAAKREEVFMNSKLAVDY